MVFDLLVANFLLVKAAIALICSAWAGWIDFKTTDIPDIFPWIMGISGIILNGLHSLLTGDPVHIMWSLGVGLGFLAFGFAYYYAKGWGGGDAKVLAGLGFLVPLAPTASALPFPLLLLINVFLVGAVYSIIFSFFIAAKNPKVWPLLRNDLRKGETLKLIAAGPLVAFLIPVGLSIYLKVPFGVSIGLALFASLFLALALLWWRLAKIIEKKVFLLKIHTALLKEGDVLARNVKIGKEVLRAGLIEGLTQKQVEEIKKRHKFVWVKEGVRFGPVFPLALLTTMLGFALF